MQSFIAILLWVIFVVICVSVIIAPFIFCRLLDIFIHFFNLKYCFQYSLQNWSQVMAYFSLFKSRKGYLSLSTMTGSFIWHRSIAWHAWSLRTLSIFTQVPLVFKVPICKITCYSDRYTFALNLFFSYSFQYSFFLHISRDRTMICHQNFLFYSCLFGV